MTAFGDFYDCLNPEQQKQVAREDGAPWSWLGGAVADAIHVLARQGRPHTATLLADADDPHAELLTLFWGPQFDREHALALWARFSQQAAGRGRAAVARAAVGRRALRRPGPRPRQHRLRRLILRHRALSE